MNILHMEVILLYTWLKVVYSRDKRPRYKGPFSMDSRERGFHIGGVYPTQDSSHLATVRMKQEEEANIRIIAKEKYEI